MYSINCLATENTNRFFIILYMFCVNNGNSPNGIISTNSILLILIETHCWNRDDA